MSLPRELERVRGELLVARRRAHDVAAPLTDDLWLARRARDQWSVAECLIHLNLTSKAFLPLITSALGEAREGARRGATTYRMDLVGRLLWWGVTLRVPIKTTEPFVPGGGQPKDTVLAEFDRLQDALVGSVEQAASLDITRRRIVSPFDPRITYNVYSALRLIPAHQRQHLRQAERVFQALSSARARWAR